MSEQREIRYYKGKYPIHILMKGKKHWSAEFTAEKPEGIEDIFVTIPRLCHRKQKCFNQRKGGK